jgi:hypothetical protein
MSVTSLLRGPVKPLPISDLQSERVSIAVSLRWAVVPGIKPGDELRWLHVLS